MVKVTVDEVGDDYLVFDGVFGMTPEELLDSAKDTITPGRTACL